MKRLFVDKKFGSAALSLIDTINGILDSYAQQGYGLSLRQCYYQLVARGVIENTERSYKNTGNLVSDAWLAGLIDWDMIKDRGREMVQNAHWDDPKDFIESVAPQFKIDHWIGQENYVEVMVEKDALSGVLEPVARKLDIAFTANKGYSSSSAMYEAGRRMLRHLSNDRHVHVIYLGDHDPSGIDMTRDVEDRLRQFAESTGDDEFTINVHRVALNMDQVHKLKPPENPAKITDSRAKEYIKNFGPSSWELDAIEPKMLARLVENAVMDLMDEDLFRASLAKQEKGREQLIEAAKKFKNI